MTTVSTHNLLISFRRQRACSLRSRANDAVRPRISHSSGMGRAEAERVPRAMGDVPLLLGAKVPALQVLVRVRSAAGDTFPDSRRERTKQKGHGQRPWPFAVGCRTGL